MVYRVIGVMSGSSLDGLDIAYVELHENAGRWEFTIQKADCRPFPANMAERLAAATRLTALDYQLLHTEFGHYIGQEVNRFIEENELHYQVALIASHGHTSFHLPVQGMTAQLGDGAAIAATTGLPVVNDLRALDVAFGGQGAPIVPIGEKFLLTDYRYFLNLGGIANISYRDNNKNSSVGFDICAANRVLNMLAADTGRKYDQGGTIAASGTIHEGLLNELNAIGYYQLPFPKSLSNALGTDIVYPIISRSGTNNSDSLRTYVEHIAIQIRNAIGQLNPQGAKGEQAKLLVTGGGAFNHFLIQRLDFWLSPLGIQVVIPDDTLVQYKEALIMAFMGVLRWRQEYNVLASVTGARRDSIGGALWNGQEA